MSKHVFPKHPTFLSRFAWYRRLFKGNWIRFEYNTASNWYNPKDGILGYCWPGRNIWSQDERLFGKRYFYANNHEYTEQSKSPFLCRLLTLAVVTTVPAQCHA